MTDEEDLEKYYVIACNKHGNYDVNVETFDTSNADRKLYLDIKYGNNKVFYGPFQRKEDTRDIVRNIEDIYNEKGIYFETNKKY